MPAIASVLAELARDPAKAEEFAADRAAFKEWLEERGLKPGQVAIVLSGNLQRIGRAIDYEYAAEAAEQLPRYNAPGAVAMMVIWRPPPPPPGEDS
jgi:hypothetical protein